VNVFELMAVITLNRDSYKKGLEEASKDTEKTGSKLRTTLGTVSKVAGATVTAIAGAATSAVGSITSFASSSATAMDTIDKQSQKMGISAEGYQEWAHALDLSGASVDSLQTSMRTLSSVMTQADDESKDSSKYLAQLGVAVEDTEGNMRSTEDVMNDVILALADMEEGAERTTIASKLLGRSATELGPLFNAGSDAIKDMKQEAHDLGLVMSNDAVKGGAKLNDTLTNLKGSFGAMKNSLGSSLMPIVQKFADLLLQAMPRIQALFDKIAPVLANMFEKIMPPLMDLVDAILPVFAEILDAIMPIISELCEMILPIITELLQNLAPIISELFQHLMPIVKAILDAIKPVLDALMPILSAIFDVVGKLLGPIMDLVGNLLQPLLTLLKPIEGLLKPIVGLIEGVGNVLKPLLDLVNDLLKPINEFIDTIFGGLTGGMKDVEDGIGDENKGGIMGALSKIMGVIEGPLGWAFNTFGDILSTAFDAIGAVFGGIIDFIDDPQKALSDFFDWITEKSKKAADLLADVWDVLTYDEDTKARDRVNQANQAILDRGGPEADALRERMVFSGVKGWTMETTRVPGLAAGGVLEPNKPFLALLGDQKNGLNVEAPLETITNAMLTALRTDAVNHSGNENLQSIPAQPIVVSVRLEGELEGLFRALQEQDAEQVSITGRPSWAMG